LLPFVEKAGTDLIPAFSVDLQFATTIANWKKVVKQRVIVPDAPLTLN
jgi:hypothetical protein